MSMKRKKKKRNTYSNSAIFVMMMSSSLTAAPPPPSPTPTSAPEERGGVGRAGVTQVIEEVGGEREEMEVQSMLLLQQALVRVGVVWWLWWCRLLVRWFEPPRLWCRLPGFWVAL